jgi:hypothetical protein
MEKVAGSSPVESTMHRDAMHALRSSKSEAELP